MTLLNVSIAAEIVLTKAIIWHPGPLLPARINLILVWISNCIHYKVLDKITYPFQSMAASLKFGNK